MIRCHGSGRRTALPVTLGRTVVLLLIALLDIPTAAWAQAIKVMQTDPAANAVLDRAPQGFSVRFDKPVDHIRSVLFIKRAGNLVETLHPRFKTEPQVLFASSAPLPAGEYTLSWSVISLEDTHVTEGEIPFTITAGKRP
ncbi:MAG: copper resistance protein CopC [Alphaproteobacteria bacterium]|nr:copper resistance protein CopC [Alphaproteobacteria bacterium]MBV8409815.1 copper resistance protein CopC [Alphaproteobacteria bacterium]